MEAVRVHISSAPDDLRPLFELRRRLRPWRSYGVQTCDRVEDADLLVMLVSDSFLAWSEDTPELQMALWRADHGLGRIQPVLLEECGWLGAPYGDRSALPSGARPVAGWDSRAEAWDDVVGGLLEQVFELRHGRQSVGTTTARMLSVQIEEALAERERHVAGLNPLSTVELHLDVPFHRFDDRRWRRTTRALRLATEDLTMRVRRLRRGEAHVILDLAARPEGLVRLAEIRGKAELEPLLGTRVLALEYLSTDAIPVAAGLETPLAPYPTVPGDLPREVRARRPLPTMLPSPSAPPPEAVAAVASRGPTRGGPRAEGGSEVFASPLPIRAHDEATVTDLFAAAPARELTATGDLRPLRRWAIPLAVLLIGGAIGLLGAAGAWWTLTRAPAGEESVPAAEVLITPSMQPLPSSVVPPGGRAPVVEPAPVAASEPVAVPRSPVEATPALAEASVLARWGGGDAAIDAGDGPAYASALMGLLAEIGERTVPGRGEMHTAALRSFARAQRSIAFERSEVPAPARLDFFGDADRANSFTLGRGVAYGPVDLRVRTVARGRDAVLVEVRAATGPARPAIGWVDASVLGAR